MHKSVWIVGAGYMAEEYLKVLTKMEVVPYIIGNSQEKTAKLAEKYGVDYSVGGFEKINSSFPLPDFVILACSIEKLVSAAEHFIQCGIKNLLCEKPVSFFEKDIERLRNLAKQHEASVSVAYNRRYYSSVEQGLDLIKEDGGVESAIFDFTEWESHYDAEDNSTELKENWLIANSSHVIDMAFFLIGKPKTLSVLKVSKPNRIFIGQGVSVRNIPFSYHSNWLSAGRWGIEIMTQKRKIIYRPLEKLQFQMRNSLLVEQVDPHPIDSEFKPGLFKLVQNFLDKNTENLISLEQHQEHFKTYVSIQNNT